MPTYRFRSRGKQVPSSMPYSIVGYGPNPPATTGGVVQVASQGGTFAYIRDYVTPGFRKSGDFNKWVSNPYDSGSLVVNTANSSTTTTNVPDGTGRGLQRTWSGDALGYIFGALCNSAGTVSFGSYPDIVNTTRVRENAIVACLNKINPALNQSWIIAAEANKSVLMILDRARKLAKVYRAFRTGDIWTLDREFPGKRTKRYPKKIAFWDTDAGPTVRKNGKTRARYTLKPLRRVDIDNLSDAARLELEYRYGWTPLVHDIADSLKAINAQMLRDELSSKTFLAVNAIKEGRGESTTPLSATGDGGTFVGSRLLIHKVTARAYAKYTVQHQAGLANRMQEFGIFDIPRAVWDVVPLSFVFDWFIPVGNWLGACTPKVGVNVIESGVVTTVEKSVVRKLVSYSPTSSGPGSWPSSPVDLATSDSFLATVKWRSLGLPIPLIPPTEVYINLKRLADAAALLRVMR